jgi:outer membrane protein TolC
MNNRRNNQFVALALSVLAVSGVLGAADALYGQEPGVMSRLTLQEAVERALKYHPSLQMAAAGVDAASAALAEANSSWWPRIQLEASVTRHELPMLTSPIHEFSFEVIPPLDRTLYGGSAMVGFTVFDGGGRVARIGMANAEVRGASAQTEFTRQDLIASVTVSYLRVLSAAGVLDAHETLMTALEAELERVNRRLAEGTVARVELLRVEAALAAADADRVAAAAGLDVAERNLARLIGGSAEETVAEQLLSVDLSVAAQVEPQREAYHDRSIEANPRLERARENVNSAESSRKAAAAQWWPSIELLGGLMGYGYPDGFTTEWQFGARLKYPLFTGGARSNMVARASAQYDVAQEEFRLEQLALQESVDIAITAIAKTRSHVLAIARAVDHLAEVARIEQLALEAGAGTQTDYLRAEAELARTRAALVESRHAEIAAAVELARVTGELSLAWLERALESNQ